MKLNDIKNKPNYVFVVNNNKLGYELELLKDRVEIYGKLYNLYKYVKNKDYTKITDIYIKNDTDEYNKLNKYLNPNNNIENIIQNIHIQIMTWNVGSAMDSAYTNLKKNTNRPFKDNIPIVGPNMTEYITKITSDTYQDKGIYLFQELQIQTNINRLSLDKETFVNLKYNTIGNSIHNNNNAIAYTHHFSEIKSGIMPSYAVKITGLRSSKWYFLTDKINTYAVISVHLHYPNLKSKNENNKLRPVYEIKKILDDAKKYMTKFIIIIGGDFNMTINFLEKELDSFITPSRLTDPYADIYEQEFKYTPKYSILNHIKELKLNISKNIKDVLLNPNKPYHITTINEHQIPRFTERVDYIITNAIIKSENIEGITNQDSHMKNRHIDEKYINKKCSHTLTKYNKIYQKIHKTKLNKTCSHDHVKVKLVI